MYKAQKNPIQKSVPLQENVPAKKDLLVINVQVSGISIYVKFCEKMACGIKLFNCSCMSQWARFGTSKIFIVPIV